MYWVLDMLCFIMGGVGGGFFVILVRLSFYINEGCFNYKFIVIIKLIMLVKKLLKFFFEV